MSDKKTRLLQNLRLGTAAEACRPPVGETTPNSSDGGSRASATAEVLQEPETSRSRPCAGGTNARLRDQRCRIPSVDALLQTETARELLRRYARVRVLDAVRAVIEQVRRQGNLLGTMAPEVLAKRAAKWLEADDFQRLRPVINATGVVLHTQLGRAVLPPSAVAPFAKMERCCSLQIDLDSGERGKRHAMTERLICRLTGAEAALVVNNNAAATLLALTALCADREVVVSRGQLIEIGGSFRLPDCIRQAGATMIEVGATNKTHLRDYETAINERTAAVLRVNPSNYRIVGFTKQVAVVDLAGLKKKWPDLLVIDDLGCGALVDLTRFGLPYEPTVPESLRSGADLALFSGDKLIGGPQAGILAGRADLMAKLRKHPLTRMLRVGKLTDLALEHTLRLFLEPERLPETNPTWRMLTADPGSLRKRAESLVAAVRRAGVSAQHIRCLPCESITGGGSLPAHPLPSFGVSIASDRVSAAGLLRRLRRYDPPVIGRLVQDTVRLDVRTLLEEEDGVVSDAIVAALAPGEGEES